MKSVGGLGQDVIAVMTAAAVLDDDEMLDLIYDTVSDMDDAAELIYALAHFAHGVARGAGVEDLTPALSDLGMRVAADPEVLN